MKGTVPPLDKHKMLQTQVHDISILLHKRSQFYQCLLKLFTFKLCEIQQFLSMTYPCSGISNFNMYQAMKEVKIYIFSVMRSCIRWLMI